MKKTTKQITVKHRTAKRGRKTNQELRDRKLNRRMLYFWLLLIILFITYTINVDIVKPDKNKNIILTEIELATESINNLIVEVSEEEKLELININVCSSSSSKTYMDFNKITNKSSTQYRYIKENMLIDMRGHLIDKDGYIGIALGSYFGSIGNKFIFTLENGQQLKVVKVEAKADKHTNNGCEQHWDKSVIEFVVDKKIASNYYGVASNGYIQSGNFNNLAEFKGKINKIEKVVE